MESACKASVLSITMADILGVEIQLPPHDYQVTHRSEGINQCQRHEDLGVVD